MFWRSRNEGLRLIEMRTPGIGLELISCTIRSGDIETAESSKVG